MTTQLGHKLFVVRQICPVSTVTEFDNLFVTLLHVAMSAMPNHLLVHYKLAMVLNLSVKSVENSGESNSTPTGMSEVSLQTLTCSAKLKEMLHHPPPLLDRSKMCKLTEKLLTC